MKIYVSADLPLGTEVPVQLSELDQSMWDTLEAAGLIPLPDGAVLVLSPPVTVSSRLAPPGAVTPPKVWIEHLVEGT